MAKERLSKLQKNILTALLMSPQGDYEDIEFINKDDKPGIDKLVSDGYEFKNALLDRKTNQPTGELRYGKKIPKYQLRREALLFNINDWQKYNKYTKECGFAQLAKWRGIPEGYNKKQTAFTRSLQTLYARDQVNLLDHFEQPVAIYGKGFAAKTGEKPQTIEEYRAEGLASYKEVYEKDKTKDPTIGTFEEWFHKPFQPQFQGYPLGGITTRSKNFLESYGGFMGRNIKYVRLTIKGTEQAKVFLKVK